MRRRACLYAFGVALIAGCTDRFDDRPSTPGEHTGERPAFDVPLTPFEPIDAIEIVRHELRRDDEGTITESVSVVGDAKNDSAWWWNVVTIRASFYDADERELDWGVDMLSDVESGQTTEFEILYPERGDDARDVEGYDVSVDWVM